MIFLDTHVIVWLYAGCINKLSKKAITQIEENELFISQVVRLELQYLFEIGRITVKPEDLIQTLNKSIGLKISQMKVDQVFDQAVKCFWTRDVFDRLIAAEAESSDLMLITKDEKILRHYEKALW